MFTFSGFLFMSGCVGNQRLFHNMCNMTCFACGLVVAFAELQTEVTDLTSDLGGLSGIPFRDYRSFTMRVLFPSVPENDHPITRPFDVSKICSNSV